MYLSIKIALILILVIRIAENKLTFYILDYMPLYNCT